MSSALRWLFDNIVGLVVEDGQLAIGIVLALVVTAALSALGASVDALLGWVLLLLLVIVLLANLLVTARRAKRRIT